MKCLALGLLFVASIVSAKEKCAKSLVRTWVDGNPRVETTRLCLDDETRPGAPPDPGYLISEGCLRQKPCAALTAARELSKLRDDQTKDRFGRRFSWCKTMGGSPQVIEHQWQGRFRPSDRCLFPDHSFIDTISLVGLGRFAPNNVIKAPVAPSTRKARSSDAVDQDRKR